MTHPASLEQIKEFMDEVVFNAQRLNLRPQDMVLACGMLGGTISNALVDDGGYAREEALDIVRGTFNDGMAMMITDLDGEDIVTSRKTIQ